MSAGQEPLWRILARGAKAGAILYLRALRHGRSFREQVEHDRREMQRAALGLRRRP